MDRRPYVPERYSSNNRDTVPVFNRDNGPSMYHRERPRGRRKFPHYRFNGGQVGNDAMNEDFSPWSTESRDQFNYFILEKDNFVSPAPVGPPMKRVSSMKVEQPLPLQMKDISAISPPEDRRRRLSRHSDQENISNSDNSERSSFDVSGQSGGSENDYPMYSDDEEDVGRGRKMKQKKKAVVKRVKKKVARKKMTVSGWKTDNRVDLRKSVDDFKKKIRKELPPFHNFGWKNVDVQGKNHMKTFNAKVRKNSEVYYHPFCFDNFAKVMDNIIPRRIKSSQYDKWKDFVPKKKTTKRASRKVSAPARSTRKFPRLPQEDDGFALENENSPNRQLKNEQQRQHFERENLHETTSARQPQPVRFLVPSASPISSASKRFFKRKSFFDPKNADATRVIQQRERLTRSFEQSNPREIPTEFRVTKFEPKKDPWGRFDPRNYRGLPHSVIQYIPPAGNRAVTSLDSVSTLLKQISK